MQSIMKLQPIIEIKTAEEYLIKEDVIFNDKSNRISKALITDKDSNEINLENFTTY